MTFDWHVNGFLHLGKLKTILYHVSMIQKYQWVKLISILIDDFVLNHKHFS